MENVEGLIKGNAVKYVHRVYDKFKLIGYQVRCYLCKAENMGVPQMRHRVFFIATKDRNFDYANLDMNFNYESVPYGCIKDGIGKKWDDTTVMGRLVLNAISGDIDCSDVSMRLYGKSKLWSHRFCYPDKVIYTMTSNRDTFIDFEEKANISDNTARNSQTFPQDYDFNGNSVFYVCGMSVPPIMIKRIVNRMRKAKMI